MTDNKKIEVEYLATAADYRRVLLRYRWKRLAAIIAVAVLIEFVVLYSAFFTMDASARPPGFVLWFLLVLPLLILAIFYWGISRQAERIEKLFEPVKAVFDENGIRSKGESSTAEMAWEDFYRVQETKLDFIFYPEKNIFYTIPKRFFGSEGKVKDFRELLKDSLNSKIKLLV
jgi:hypothetical protein